MHDLYQSAASQGLVTRLRDIEQQYVSLRDNLRLQVSRDPREIVEPFRMIRQRISNFCSGLSAAISDNLQDTFPDISSSTYAVHPERLLHLLSTISTLYVSPSGEGRNIEDFTYYALLHALGIALKCDLFDRFHPHTSKSEDLHMCNMYNAIRNNEIQIKSGWWRSDVFKATDALRKPEELDEAWAQKFVQEFESGFITQLMTALCGSWDPSTIFEVESLRGELFDIALSSYRWNRDTKANFVHLDFHPTMFEGGTEFLSDSMTLFGQKNSKKSSPIPSGPIISSAGLGLLSTLSYGEENWIERHWQMEVEVVMEVVF